MGTIVAAQTGNWSSASTWTGGALPTTGDTAQTGNFAVTIDQSITVATLEPTGSGRFEVNSGGITINANVVMSSTYSGGGLRCAHTTGTVTLNGNVTGGSAANAHALNHTAAGHVIINGNVTGGSGSSATGARNAAGSASATLTINGDATAGSGSNAYGALMHNVDGILLVTGYAIGNDYGPGGSTSGSTPGVYGGHSANSTTKVRQVKSGPYGAPGIGGAVLLDDHADNEAEFRTVTNGATKTLGAADCDYPAESDVRAGTDYGDSAYTGTLAVPQPEQVAYGVATDDTTGAAVLTPEDVANAVWDEANSLHLTAGSTGKALNDAGAGFPDAEEIADAVWDEAVSGHLVAGSTGKALNDAGAQSDPWGEELPGSYLTGTAGWILGERLDAKVSTVTGGGPGSGATEWKYTLTEQGTGDPIPEADVWISSDSDGSTILASGRTNSSGIATFYLDSGTVYVWRQKAGWNFTNPDVEIVG